MLRLSTRVGPSALALALMVAVLALPLAGPAHAAGLPQQASVEGGIDYWYTLAGGPSVDWVFNYSGNNQPALIAIGIDPANAITVNVYDDGQWKALGAGNRSITPVGRGTSGTIGNWSSNQDLIDNGDLFWEAGARPPVIFHVQVVNTTQAPARYWIAQAGPGAGGLTPNFPLAAPTPTTQPAPSSPAAPAGRATSAGAGAAPPQTLPVSGSVALPLFFGSGLALVCAGWLIRPRTP